MATRPPGVTPDGPGRWRVRATLVAPDGRRLYRKGVVTGSLRDATRARAELLEALHAEVDAAAAPAPSLLAGCVLAWWQTRGARLRPSTRGTYLTCRW